MKKIKEFWIFIGILILINFVIYLTKPGGDAVLKIISICLPVICSFITSFCLFKAYKEFKKFDFTKVAWLMLTIGMSLNFIAETTYGILDLIFGVDVNEVFPTLADYFWCVSYIPIFIALAMMFHGYKKSGFPLGNQKFYTIVSPVMLILLSLVIYYLLIPIIRDKNIILIQKVFYLFYPIADLFVVIPAIMLMYITNLFGKGIISKPWRYLTIGFICFTIADLLYSYLCWLDLYDDGNLIDIAWNFGYLLIGLSGLHQKQLIDSLK